METLLVLVALGVAAFYFFRGNINRGAEILRSDAFLEKLEKGATLEEARYLADNIVDIQSRFSTEDQCRDGMFIKIRRDTKYGGKSFSMIADAYQKGMTPGLSLWQQKAILSSIQSPREATVSQVKTNASPVQMNKEDYEANGHEPKLKLVIPVKSVPQDFEEYQKLVLSEVKRLDGKREDELHWSEILDDDGTKRAFEDGVNPKTLAAMIVERGIPLPDPSTIELLLENDGEFRALKHLATLGEAAAQGKLGLLYLGGIGTPLNAGEAVKWFRLAADQGKSDAQFALGMLFFDGQFVPQDLVQAHFWISLAAIGFQESDNGLSKSAVQQRANIVVKMTLEQIVEAQRLAQEWIATHPKN
jgi:hypothetical protein